MSVLLVGGHDRMLNEYKIIGGKLGHRVKVFTQQSARFDKNIGSPDIIVLFTSTVSHNMISIATKAAKKKNIPILRCHTSSANSLEETLKKIG